MQASMNDIKKLQSNIFNQGVLLPSGQYQKLQLIEIQDPTLGTNQQSMPKAGGENRLEISFRFWTEHHLTNSEPDDEKVGTVLIRVLLISPEHRGGESDWMDPVDLDGSGLAAWAAHELGV